MTLQTSGAITLADIQTEFGGANPIGLNEYYAGGTYVPSGTSGTNGAVPTSGTISLWNFFGTSNWVDKVLNNPTSEINSFFGSITNIHANYAIVGYPLDDSVEADSGKAFIFNIATGGLVATLTNPNYYSTAAGDQFGRSVSIATNYAIVSASFEDDAAGSAPGVTYVYKSANGLWTDTTLWATILDPNAYGTSFNDQFGGYGNAQQGNYAFIAAMNEDFGGGGGVSGTVYLYNISSNTLLLTINDPNNYSTHVGDEFGRSIEMSGNYAIISASGEADAGGNQSGVAYIYKTTNGVWTDTTLTQTILNPNAYSTSETDRFGWSVGISGNYAIVGAQSEDDAGGVSSGKAYIFNVTNGALVFTIDNPNAYSTSAIDQFGYAVTMSDNYACVGAYNEDDASGAASGKVYVFKTTNGVWTDTTLVRTIDNPSAYSTGAGDRFGISIRMYGDKLIVGADAEDSAAGAASGKAYIFKV